jgi:manganese/iron transport system permease protein
MISFHANTSGSATIAIVPIVLFFIVLAIRSALQRRRRVPESATAV